jgi:cell division protein FtsA
MSIFPKKSTSERDEIIAALDIGSSKICCTIAKINAHNTAAEENPLRIMGVGHQLSKGLKSSNIIDLEALEDAILHAVHSAEQQSMRNIASAYVNLPAGGTLSQTFRNEIYLGGATVDESHLRKLLSLNKDALGSDRYVIHVLPMSYTLDGVRGIRDPRGMIGDKLSVVLHVVSAPIGLVKNFMACIGRCHLDVRGFVVSPYATGLSTLVDDEMELGATVIDMGGGHTTLGFFTEGNFVQSASIPLGGAVITNDIARGLTTPLSQAERLKTLYGSVIPSPAEDRETIMITQMGEHAAAQTNQILKSTLTHIIRARVEEIFELVQNKMRTMDVDPIVFQRIVLTGGSSQIQGMRELAMHAFGKPVRIASPKGIFGTGDLIETPMFTTCAGLLQYGLQDLSGKEKSIPLNRQGLWNKLGSWFKQNF